MLADMETSGTCSEALYLPPGLPTPEGLAANLREAVALAGESETGLVLIVEEDRVTAVAPPFPLARGTGDAIEAVRNLLASRLKIGVVLIRLGRYAVGVLEGDRLVVSKTGTRYVEEQAQGGGIITAPIRAEPRAASPRAIRQDLSGHPRYSLAALREPGPCPARWRQDDSEALPGPM